ncbi:hypothetical protein FE257_009873 [Aspergillus nanangensis]|uniref:Major facilitator superfamily (MFS) profile domain-containing protein n=1 Tax=Aspergillus nanangensis TaxID=2582783 RepID=A0AAD4CVY3_ASPNN|nr:hypothetical protein FE257_009873 [Aspergillus nanangensis]
MAAEESAVKETNITTTPPQSTASTGEMDGFIDFDGPLDPLHPFNWPLKKKIIATALLCISTMIVSFASSIFAPAIPVLMKHYHVGRQVCTLGVSLYVWGFAFGPLVFGPFSEMRGRYLPIVLSMAGFIVFSFATAVSQDVPALFILRFFTGFFGSGPLTLCGPVLTDMYTPQQRGLPIIIFALTVFTGPLVAPFVGGFIVMNPHLGWRWTSYLPGILGGSIRAPHEELRVDIAHIVSDYLAHPLKMIVFDPITLCMCLFGSFVYGLLYLFLTAYPRIFQMVYKMNPGVGGLPYIGIIVGQLLGAVAMCATQPWLVRRLKANNGVMVPEWRLPIAVPGAVAFAAGLFWLGWTGHTREFGWVVPTASGLLTGFGLLTMFLPSLSYLIEARTSRSASAVAAHTFLRSGAGGAFPLFAWQMFDGLGIEWACTLLGCVAAVMAPIPVLLYVFGGQIREKGRFSKV